MKTSKDSVFLLLSVRWTQNSRAGNSHAVGSIRSPLSFAKHHFLPGAMPMKIQNGRVSLIRRSNGPPTLTNSSLFLAASHSALLYSLLLSRPFFGDRPFPQRLLLGNGCLFGRLLLGNCLFTSLFGQAQGASLRFDGCLGASVLLRKLDDDAFAGEVGAPVAGIRLS